MNEQTSQTQNDDDEIDLLELFHTILEGKWLILLISILSLALALIFAFGQQPTYKADTLLQVETKKAAVPGIEELAGLGGDDTSVGTELEIIKSRKILGQAISDLHLDIVAKPKRVPLLGNFYKSLFNSDSVSKPFGLPSKYAWGKEKIKINRLEVGQDLLNENLVLRSNGEGKYSLAHEDKILISGMVGEFEKNQDITINVSELDAEEGTEFSLTKLSNLNAIDALKTHIKASEKGKKTGIINLVLEGKNKALIVDTLDNISNTYLQQNKSRSSEEASNALNFLNEQIKPIKEQADIAEASIKKYRINNQTADMSIETQSILSVIADIDTELQTLSLKRDELSLKYTDNHPTFQAIQSQELKLKQRKEKTLSEISILPETQQELLKLERDYKVANTIYGDLLNNIQEFKIAKASSIGNVYILDSAVVHDKPIKPKKAMILALGALLGGMLGVLIVFLRKALHQFVNNPEKLEAATGKPVYATVPFTKDVNLTRGRGLKKTKQQKTLLAIEKTADPAIESLRSLRTSLHFALLEAKNNIVMITGPSPGIGKSFVSSNFAAVIASSEQRVLLIDADMRKGYLHNLLNKDVTPGLSDLISGSATLDQAIHPIQIGEHSLDIITRGITPPNPSELLMHSTFEKLLNELSKIYDLILIDTPPVLAVTDPSIIGKLAGVVFMVVRSNQHSMKEIEHAVSRLSNTGIETKGFIFNAYVPPKSGYGGYGYHSYYGDYESDK